VVGELIAAAAQLILFQRTRSKDTIFYPFLGPAANGGRALTGLASLLGPAPASWLGLPLRGTLAGP